MAEVRDGHVSTEVGWRAILQSLYLLEQKLIWTFRIEGPEVVVVVGMFWKFWKLNIIYISTYQFIIWIQNKRTLEIFRSCNICLTDSHNIIYLSLYKVFLESWAQGFCGSQWRRRSCCKCPGAQQEQPQQFVARKWGILHHFPYFSFLEVAALKSQDPETQEIRVLHALGDILSWNHCNWKTPEPHKIYL